MTDRVHMPLNQAFLCLDDHCQSVGNDERTCVACGSKYPMPLANCLNRPSSIPSIDPNSPEWEGRN